MNGIAIYLEGGGDGLDTKDALRRGMEAFLSQLREAAREKGMPWKLVACGSRTTAFNGWDKGRSDARYPIRLLLVDAESPVSRGIAEHLATRQEDQWPISDSDEDRVHLMVQVMVQVMETWIIADVPALVCYYGKGFREEALPSAKPLEDVLKYDIRHALRKATKETHSGRYHKTRHAPDLLERIDPDLVRKRCRMCDRLFEVVDGLIRAA